MLIKEIHNTHTYFPRGKKTTSTRGRSFCIWDRHPTPNSYTPIKTLSYTPINTPTRRTHTHIPSTRTRGHHSYTPNRHPSIDTSTPRAHTHAPSTRRRGTPFSHPSHLSHAGGGHHSHTQKNTLPTPIDTSLPPPLQHAAHTHTHVPSTRRRGTPFPWPRRCEQGRRCPPPAPACQPARGPRARSPARPTRRLP